MEEAEMSSRITVESTGEARRRMVVGFCLKERSSTCRRTGQTSERRLVVGLESSTRCSSTGEATVRCSNVGDWQPITVSDVTEGQRREGFKKVTGA
jgi:hypothetical protein